MLAGREGAAMDQLIQDCTYITVLAVDTEERVEGNQI